GLQLTLATFIRNLVNAHRQAPDAAAVPVPRADPGIASCPVSSAGPVAVPAAAGMPAPPAVDEAEALMFIEQYYAECSPEVGGSSRGHRMEAVLREIAET